MSVGAAFSNTAGAAVTGHHGQKKAPDLEKVLDICARLTSAKVSEVLGDAVTGTISGGSAASGFGDCYYKLANGDTVQVKVTLHESATEAHEWVDFLTEPSFPGQTGTPVSGVGEYARYRAPYSGPGGVGLQGLGAQRGHVTVIVASEDPTARQDTLAALAAAALKDKGLIAAGASARKEAAQKAGKKKALDVCAQVPAAKAQQAVGEAVVEVTGASTERSGNCDYELANGWLRVLVSLEGSAGEAKARVEGETTPAFPAQTTTPVSGAGEYAVYLAPYYGSDGVGPQRLAAHRGRVAVIVHYDDYDYENVESRQEGLAALAAAALQGKWPT